MYNLNSGYGMLQAIAIANGLTTFGRFLLVMPSTDPNYDLWSQLISHDPDGNIRIFGTLKEAYDAATTQRNDVIMLSAYATHAVATGIAWSKSRIHVIGLDGGDRLVQQGSKIELTGAVDSAYVLKVTGTRNSFRNLKVIQSSTHANALNVIQYAGEGNLYKNVSAVFGVVDNLDLTTSSEALMGEDSGTFINCSWGTDVLLTSGARAVMTLDAITGASSADGAKSNRFVDCEWFIMSSEANAVLIKLADTAGAKFLNSFVNPRFAATINQTNVAVAITNAIASASGFVEGTLAFYRPTTINCTNGCATTKDNVMISGAPVYSSNAWEGGVPA
jgi:hypothetical protein